VAFGNVQDVRPEAKAGNAEFTLKVAFGGLRFFRIVQFFAKREGSTPLSADAREVLEESVRRWNQTSEERIHTMLKTNARKARIRQITLVGAMLITAGFALTQTSAAVRQQAPPPDRAQGAAMGPSMGQTMANMKALDKTLDDLVARIDATRGTEKVDAIAAVVKAIVAERAQMRDHMMTMMQGGMMEQMMSMPGGQKPSDADHSAHHPEK
jgi:hypothetical protein